MSIAGTALTARGSTGRSASRSSTRYRNGSITPTTPSTNRTARPAPGSTSSIRPDTWSTTSTRIAASVPQEHGEQAVTVPTELGRDPQNRTDANHVPALTIPMSG